MNAYQALSLLGLSEDTSEIAITKAFREGLKKAHPDLNGGTDLLLRKLIVARDCLMACEFPDHVPDHVNEKEAPFELKVTLNDALFGTSKAIAVDGALFTLPAGLRDREIIVDPSGHKRTILIIPDPKARIIGHDIWM